MHNFIKVNYGLNEYYIVNKLAISSLLNYVLKKYNSIKVLFKDITIDKTLTSFDCIIKAKKNDPKDKTSTIISKIKKDFQDKLYGLVEDFSFNMTIIILD